MMKNIFGMTAAFLLTASIAHAQTPDWTMGIKLGKPIFLTTESGERVEGVTGQITPEGIMVATPVGVRTVAYRDLRLAQKRDSVKNGVWIGAAVGFGLGLAAVLTDDSECRGECQSEEAAVPMGGALYGALIGWGVDHWIKGKTTLFDRRTDVALSVTPKRGGATASLSLRW